ncbi:MAG: MerR family transcriptional regulator [Myxococcota bacterium]|nr:MerR family transcriptional regulator [Myxococcota bacterium]
MAARNRKASASKASRKASRAKTTGTRRKKAAKPTRAVAPPEAQEASVLDQLPEGKLYYRIGEVAQITDVKPHVLRYWETEFRWMAPPKSRSKQRLYRRKDIEMILAIKRLLYEERYTIAGARQQLKELGLGGVEEAAAANGGAKTSARRDPSAEEVSAGRLADELRATYQRLRGELQEIRDLL